MDLYEDYGLLTKRWVIKAGATKAQILSLARRYLGSEFDLWLTKHTITLSQSQTLIKKLKGLNYAAKQIEELSLEELKVLASDVGLNVFEQNKAHECVLTVLEAELKRLRPESIFLKVIPTMACLADWSIEEEVFNRLRPSQFEAACEFVVEQAYRELHRLSFSHEFEGLSVHEFDFDEVFGL